MRQGNNCPVFFWINSDEGLFSCVQDTAVRLHAAHRCGLQAFRCTSFSSVFLWEETANPAPKSQVFSCTELTQWEVNGKFLKTSRKLWRENYVCYIATTRLHSNCKGSSCIACHLKRQKSRKEESQRGPEWRPYGSLKGHLRLVWTQAGKGLDNRD